MQAANRKPFRLRSANPLANVLLLVRNGRGLRGLTLATALFFCTNVIWSTHSAFRSASCPRPPPVLFWPPFFFFFFLSFAPLLIMGGSSGVSSSSLVSLNTSASAGRSFVSPPKDSEP